MGIELYYDFCAFDVTAEVPQEMFAIQSIDLPIYLRLQPFHYNFASTSYLQTYTRSRCMYAYQTFNTHFCVLARVLADVLGPTACSTRFSGKVILVSTVSSHVAHNRTQLPHPFRHTHISHPHPHPRTFMHTPSSDAHTYISTPPATLVKQR